MADDGESLASVLIDVSFQPGRESLQRGGGRFVAEHMRRWPAKAVDDPGAELGGVVKKRSRVTLVLDERGRSSDRDAEVLADDLGGLMGLRLGARDQALNAEGALLYQHTPDYRIVY